MRISPLPPGASAALLDMQDVTKEVIAPTQPHRIFACLQAGLPPAASWTYCSAWVTDLDALAVSNGVNWINTTDGSTI